MGRMELGEQWWKGQLAADIHQTLRIKELKLPAYRAHSPQLAMRRYFADLLAVLCNRYQLCPTARHLAVYLLDLFMDHYDVAVKQLYVIALSCLLLASKFEDKEDKVPKLDHLNNLGFMCSLNLVIDKKELLKMELLVLECFNWNLCLPTPAHYIDYYLLASVGSNDLHNGWPITYLAKIKIFMEKYTHYFLEVSLQDHAFLGFRPSVVAAACISASRICLQISPSWTTQLQLLTAYSLEHLAVCVDLLLMAHDNDAKEADKAKSHSTTLPDHQQMSRPGSRQSPAQLQFQQSSHEPLTSAQPSQFQSPVQDLCSAYRDTLQAHGRSNSIQTGSSVQPCLSMQDGLQSAVKTLPIQRPVAMQVAITETRRCVSTTYGSSYLSGHHSYTEGCFDR
uniref:Cyclin-J-like protein n=1 Tax=Geotrypetes seraphini TaxID=260995 RepID=A0A6P8Q844_GEOSA|nr:cyclin-J-like protein [Geotrypetes seraphini]XP_033783127.1 cyclin-J-like protein [Geotrypetes seraphini]XP_033783128.1 cyclin-J-like protein [Geotrypetes seraphini]